MTITLCLLSSILLLAVPLAAQDEQQSEPGRWQARSMVTTKFGIVATSQTLASAAGAHILEAGGNAIDAAIAANAVLGVVEPMSDGIGGDLFAIVWEARTGKLFGLNASGRSPYRASLDEMRARGLTELPSAGPLSWSVPGAVDGW